MTRTAVLFAVFAAAAVGSGCGPGRAEPGALATDPLPPIRKNAANPAAKTDAAPGPLRPPPARP